MRSVTKYFPDRISPSSAVIVIDTGPGGHVDEATAAGFVSASLPG